jgi:hypothetical protein
LGRGSRFARVQGLDFFWESALSPSLSPALSPTLSPSLSPTFSPSLSPSLSPKGRAYPRALKASSFFLSYARPLPFSLKQAKRLFPQRNQEGLAIASWASPSPHGPSLRLMGLAFASRGPWSLRLENAFACLASLPFACASYGRLLLRSFAPLSLSLRPPSFFPQGRLQRPAALLAAGLNHVQNRLGHVP